MENGVAKTYEFIRHMGSETQSGCWSAKCKAVDNGGSADWWE